MCVVWRIATASFAASALDGEGARLYGGRWNPKGWAMIYTAASQSLALLELMVQDDRLRARYVLIPAQLPAALPETRIERVGVRIGWQSGLIDSERSLSLREGHNRPNDATPRWHSFYPPSSGNGQFAVDALERAMARSAGHPAQGRQVPGRPVGRNARRIFLHFALISIHAGFVPGAQAQAIRGLHA